MRLPFTPESPWVLQQSAPEGWVHGYEIHIMEPRNTLVATVRVPGLAHMNDRKRYYARLVRGAAEMIDMLNECRDAIEWCAVECGHKEAAALAKRIDEFLEHTTGSKP